MIELLSLLAALLFVAVLFLQGLEDFYTKKALKLIKNSCNEDFLLNDELKKVKGYFPGKQLKWLKANLEYLPEASKEVANMALKLDSINWIASVTLLLVLIFFSVIL